MKLWKFFPILFLMLSACSLRDRSDFKGVRISMPSYLKSNSSQIRKPLNSAVFVPGSIYDLNCFALNVTGPGIVKDKRFQCSSEPSKVGISKGFMPMQDSEVEMMVPVGSSRKIQLIGVHSDIGCPSFDSIFQNNFFESEEFSYGYILAESTVDVYEDVAVTLVASFEPENVFMPECSSIDVPEPEICSPGTQWNGDQCVNVCNGLATWNGSSCSCPYGMIFDESNNTCVPNCTNHTHFDINTNTCVPGCSSGEVWNGSSCQECETIQVFDPSLNDMVSRLSCTCGIGQFVQSVNYRSGAIIDRISLECVPYASGTFGNISDVIHLGGDGGGGPNPVGCSPYFLLSGIQQIVGYWGGLETVSGFELSCKNPLDLSTLNHPANYYSSPTSNLNCPIGQYVYGIETKDQNERQYLDVITELKCRAPEP